MMLKHRSWQCWKQCIMIDMHVYLPEKSRSPFLHGVFPFSKVEVLVVNFDDFFALAYSSHILWSWPLGKIWCHHTSLSSTLDLKSCQFCPIFLERESWSQPYQIFFIAPQLDHAPKCSIRVWVWGYMKEGLTRSFFFFFPMQKFGIPKLFQTQKSFWHRFKANSFWKNSSDSYGEVIRSDENVLFCFWWKIWSDIWLVEMVQDLIWEFQRTSLESIHFICMNNDLVHMRKHCLPIQIACLWSERAWFGT